MKQIHTQNKLCLYMSVLHMCVLVSKQLAVFAFTYSMIKMIKKKNKSKTVFYSVLFRMNE